MSKIEKEIPTLKERENAYLVLKDYFENCFNDRENYFETKGIKPVYSNVIEKLTMGYKVNIEKCTYREGYDFSLKSPSKENLYLYKELKNLVLTNDEKEQFYKMLRWYVMNVPCSNWEHFLNVDSSFMADVAIKYYFSEKKKRNPYKYIEKYIIMFEEARVCDSKYFNNIRFGYGKDNSFSAYDHFEYDRYKNHNIIDYSNNTIDCNYAVPRFYFKDMNLDFFSNDIIISNKDRYYDLLGMKYVEKDTFPIPFMSMIDSFKYKEVLSEIPIKSMEQVEYILKFIRNYQYFNMNEVTELCEKTYDTFSNKIWYSCYEDQTIDIETIKNELIMNLIIDYILNDGNFYYGFNYDDRRSEKAKHFNFDSSICFIRNVGDILFNDGKVTYKPFFDSEIELCHLEDNKVVIDYKEKTKKKGD